MSSAPAPDLYTAITSPRAAKWLRRAAAVDALVLASIAAFWVYTRFQSTVEVSYQSETWVGIVVAVILIVIALIIIGSVLGLVGSMLAYLASAPHVQGWHKLLLSLMVLFTVPAGALGVWWFAYRPRVNSLTVADLP